MKNIVLFVILISIGCTQTNNKVASPKITGDISVKKQAIEEYSAEHQNQDNDSIGLEGMMDTALLYAQKNINKNHFHKKIKYPRYGPDASVTIAYGYLFDSNRKHLLVERTLFGNFKYLDVYLLKGRKLKSVCQNWIKGNDYGGTYDYFRISMKDINGDHQKDILIHLYSSSGCCQRNVYMAYLYRKSTGGFTSVYEFMNPTFSPAEKIIRGVGYGWPGDVELYKYKWNGLNIDTVEFIFPDTLRKRYHVFKHWHDLNDPTKGKFITSIPKDYRKIESYDWFKGTY